MNEHIFELAIQLGEAIKESETFTKLNEIEERANSSEQLVRLSSEFDNLRYQMQELTMADNPDNEQISAITRRMSEIKRNMLDNADMKSLQKAREDFSNLMNEVNRQLQGVLNPESLNDGCAGCGGGCSSCSGCH